MPGKPPLEIVYERERLSLRGRFSPLAEPLAGVEELAKLARAVDKGTRDMVLKARSVGHSWAEIGKAIGMSAEAARERFVGSDD